METQLLENTISPNAGTVYLLHFSEKIAHAGHYIGWAKKLSGRIWHHRRGTGANLTRVAVERGIRLELAETWENKDKKFERKLKNRKSAPRFCPICKAEVPEDLNDE